MGTGPAACIWDSCFGGGTWISLRRGRKRLRDIRVGDQVLSFEVKTGRMVEREVLHVFAHGPRPVGALRAEHRAMSAGPSSITANHPVFDERAGEFVRADSLDERSRGLVWNGRTLRRLRLEARLPASTGSTDSASHRVEEVFNFTVAETHIYVADGLVVHNKTYDDEGRYGGLGGDGTGGVIQVPTEEGPASGGAGGVGGLGGLGGMGGR